MNRGRTRAFLTLIAACLVAGHLTPSAARAQVTRCDQIGSERSSVTKPGPHDFGPTGVVYLESQRDGAAIQIGLVRPRVPKGQRVPVIVQASPYFHALQTIDLQRCVPFLVDNFVPHGYAVALIPVRGTGDSGGCFELFGPGERADLDQAVRWLGSRSWSNGSVGMIGKSYDGSTPWMVAASGNPYLKTIVPVSGVPDPFDLLFGSGTPDWRGPGILAGVYFAENLQYIDGRTPTRNAETIACPEHAVAEAASAYSFLTGEVDPFGYWAARRYTEDILRRYRGSVFLVQGLQDWNVNPGIQFPLITELERRGVVVKKMLGQWGHSHPDEVGPPSERKDYADILLRWLDRWLKGDRRVSTGPAVEVEDGDGKWRRESAWPPRGRTVVLRPTTSGALSQRSNTDGGSVVVAPDPVHFRDPASAQGAGVGVPLPPQIEALCSQPTCAMFRTDPMRDVYRVTGLPRLRLHATPLGPGGTISAFLYAEGDQTLRRIAWGQVDLRFPSGEGPARSVEPGKPIPLDFTLQPFDAPVHKGERLALVLSMGNSYNRLPASAPAPVVVDLADPRTGLTLTHVTAGRSQFFRPRG